MISSTPITFGAISDQDILIKDSGEHPWCFYSFDIAPDQPSWRRIVDSAFGTPARYAQEIFKRLAEVTDINQPTCTFVFNPLFATTRASILAAVAGLHGRDDLSVPMVVADQEGLPVGYLLPSTFSLDKAVYLMLLSCVDSKLDAALLDRLCSSKTELMPMSRLGLRKHTRNGFDDNWMAPVYRWVTTRAISLLDATANSSRSSDESKQRRSAVTFTAVMPHHAGDVLFFALAFNQIDTPCQRIAVNSAYADIVRTIAPDLDVVTVPTPQVNRGAAFAKGQAVRDYDYFEAYKDTLPHDSFYIYCRPSRNYNTTDIHLIDHFAFALGYSARAQSELLIQKRPNPPRLTDPQRAGVPAKILLHFDAGWPLKIYPRKLQAELIDLLLKQNHRVTVLAAPGYDYPGITSVRYVSLSAFDALARAHDVLVGMDSFPSHYGAHILGLPTICLFASTKPVNSNAPACTYYTDLENGLNCRPCYAVSQCPVYGGTECQNFVPPRQVFDEIKRLLMGAVPSIHVVHTTLAKKNSTPGRILIRLQWVEMQVWLTNLLLPVMYGTTLLHEFVLAIKREGGLAALGRSARFISRKAWIKH